MIKLSVFYPTAEGSTFDHEYFRTTHVPMALKAWGLPEAEIDKGVNGPYAAAAHFRFESPDALDQAFALPATADVVADVANYTNITPVMQTCEVVD
jgi:uncharacterized protein (TIGR02118 family)